MNNSEARQFEDQFGNVFDDICGYWAQVEDNQLSRGDAEDAISDRTAHLENEAYYRIKDAINEEWADLFSKFA